MTSTVPPDLQNLSNPFPGLRPFQAHENHLFFGREGQSQALLDKLGRNRFVAVVGTSGSGKTSLVRAGMLPLLHGGFMAPAGSSWRIAIFRPGHDPLGNLARALCAPEVFGAHNGEAFDQAMMIETILRRSDLGLVQTVRQARMPQQENLLVVVDQFEELFRFKQTVSASQSGEEAAALVTLLLEATKSERAPIYVVLTMRSDYLGDCSQFRGLPEGINEAQYLIPRMTRDQRREAIVGPVAVGGAEMTPSLVQRLLNDVGDNPDQLPILQHALMRTWDYWASHHENAELVDLQHYEAIGGMERALSQHADEAFNELPDARGQKIAEQLFKTLTERGLDNREVRRPTRLGKICAITEAEEKEVIAVIDTFRRKGRSFLMPPIDVPLHAEAPIDISHESLIRNWELLKKWVDEESQSSYIYRRLAETAVLYQEEKAGLWRDPDLQFALLWRERIKPNPNWAQLYHSEFERAMAFLDKSQERREVETAEMEAARQRELEQAQRLVAEQSRTAKLSRRASLFLVFLLVAAVIALVATIQQQSARREATTAQLERGQAEYQRALSDSTANVFAQLFREADSLKQVAIDSAEAAKIARLETEAQRLRALSALDSAQIERQRAETQAILAEARRNEAVAAREIAQKSQQQVLAVALTVNAQRQQQAGRDTLSALLALESFRFDKLSGGHFRSEVYDALRKALNAFEAGGSPIVWRGHTGAIAAVAVSPMGDRVASCGSDSTVRWWDLQERTKPQILLKRSDAMTAIAFSHDGKSLAAGSADGAILLWSLQKVISKPTHVDAHSSRVWGLAFNPVQAMFASCGADGSVMRWNLRDMTSRLVGRHSGSARAVAFHPSGVRLASTGADNNVLLWDLSNPTNLPAPDTLKFQSLVRTIAFSPDGEMLATGMEDKSVRLIWLRQNREQILRGHQNRVNTVAFSPKGKLLASGSSDKTVRLWDLDRLEVGPIVLSEHESSVWSIAFASQGDKLVSGSGNDIRLWITSSESLAERIRTKVRRYLTLEEWRDFVGRGIEYPY